MAMPGNLMNAPLHFNHFGVALQIHARISTKAIPFHASIRLAWGGIGLWSNGKNLFSHMSAQSSVAKRRKQSGFGGEKETSRYSGYMPVYSSFPKPDGH